MLVRCLAMMRGGGETRHLAWAHELSALGVDVDILAGRPLLGWSSYKTPIANLWMCGAGTHPGGEVSGAPGHNAAHAILRDWT